ncbi:thioredoxin domain-containing protein [Sphingobacterium bovistauri]|uniref:Photosynthetic protein synthase I n=1 Tax=Sphingobacterium bovistauri TaxID=2781959 RepID=A0ABS7Z196_9SPHI|nr:photosynthetic protein synthase I [Sphingobacterium bovistauri]MCA5003901.1 photosynthetic protein synthase I [Sphingobacterium bovistauri]
MNNSSKKRNISTIIILAIVLLVPGFLYITLNKIGSNQYLKLPIYGDKVLTGKMNRKMGRERPDTSYHQIAPIKLINADLDTVDFLKEDTVISVVHLFTANDDGLSQNLISSLKPVVERFKNIHKVKFYSISLNPNESVEDLKRLQNVYAKPYTSTWFVVKPDTAITNYVQSNFLIDAHINQDSTFTFSNNYLLIDTERRIRGFYDMNQNKEMERLEDEIKVQLVEEARNNPLKIEKK